MTFVDPVTRDGAESIRETERRRLRSLVEANLDVADALHAPEFQLVHPGGGVWTKEQYLGGISSGSINYRRFESVSQIEVIIEGNMAAIRYRSAIDIHVQGQESGSLQCWHTDIYRRNRADIWRVSWSQATAIDQG